ncbi:MAG: hypothetical protein C5B52_03430 [Bacteroidetes bacterium]|nr:MAG: hypothetical protein C5B52_03430 [Bacteroidota bacterium]
MKKFLLSSTLTLMICAVAMIGKGQVQLGVHGSRLNGTDADQWGAGVNLKYLFDNHLALGGAVRWYPKNLKTDTYEVNGTKYNYQHGNVILPVTGSVDYYFGTAPVRPYIGSDVGVYFTKYVVTTEGANYASYSQSNNKAYFGVAPRAGLDVEFGKSFGVFGQAGYNYLFGYGDGNHITIPGINTPLTTKATNKFWTFDLGLLFKFGS